MKKYIRSGIFTVISLLLCDQLALGSGFRNPPEGAAALGRVGGRIAHVNDPSAIVNSPANIADIKESTILASYLFIYSDVEYRRADGTRASTRDQDKHIPSFFAVIPMGGDNSTVLGVGISSPWGQSTVWPKTGPFLGSAPHFAELITINVNPTVARRLSDNVLVGAGVDIMYSEVDLRQSLPLLGPAGPLTGVRLTGDGFGLGVHGGITFELSDNQRCAATVRSPIKIEYEGDTDVNGFTGPLATRSDFDSEIEFPTMVGLGYGVEFDNGLRVGIDVEWIEFSTFDEFPVDVGVNGAVGLFPPSIPQDWDDTWTFGIGGDMPISEEWILRAGYIHMETPIPEATMAPTLPDDDRNVFSIGLGHTGENHTLDIAYAINVFERKIDSSPIPAFNGEYELTGQMVQVSYRRAL